LALASKNEETDVSAVFQREEMELRRDDFVAWKVNWYPKSQNISALAAELELGLDSFLFLDDSPTECAEVESHCPAVTTLLLPADSKRIPDFLKNVWAFDQEASTGVDKSRTELYREQGERNRAEASASSFQEFIASLDLQVRSRIPLAADYDRAAQLTQRTNQFNNSGIRRTATELAFLLESARLRALIVGVKDRFGDYGDVGLITYQIAQDVLKVESFLMSCRVLGKGIEHQLLADLGKEAKSAGASKITFSFVRTKRNQPIEKFLQNVGARLSDQGDYCLSVDTAAATVFDPDSGSETGDYGQAADAPATAHYSVRPDYRAIATNLNTIQSILESASRELRRERPLLENTLVLPRTMEETKLVSLWEEVLRVYRIGVTDRFLHLGGQSLHAVAVASRIVAEFGVRLPLSALLSNPDIRELVELIHGSKRSDSFVSIPKAKELLFSPAH